jgi:hypothetical protein
MVFVPLFKIRVNSNRITISDFYKYKSIAEASHCGKYDVIMGKKIVIASGLSKFIAAVSDLTAFAAPESVKGILIFLPQKRQFNMSQTI